MTIKNYIKTKKTKHFTINNIEVFVKDEVESDNISVKNVMLSLTDRIPKHLMRNIETTDHENTELNKMYN